MGNVSPEDFHLDFKPYIAGVIGGCESLIVSLIRFRLALWQNDKENSHYRDGQWWYYDTVDKIVSDLQIFSKRTVERSLKNLKDMGIVKIAHYGGKHDRTNWYTIDIDRLYEVVGEVHPGFLNKIGGLHTATQTVYTATEAESIYIYNSYSNNNTKKVSLRKAERMRDLPCSDETDSHLFFRQLKTEDEDQECKAYMSNALDSILKVYQEVKMDDLEGGRRRIIESLRDLPSVHEIKRHVEGIRLGIDEYLNEYESNRNHTNRDTGQIDYTYLPKLSNLIESNFVNDQLGYYAKGLQIYDSAKEGEANAG